MFNSESGNNPTDIKNKDSLSELDINIANKQVELITNERTSKNSKTSNDFVLKKRGDSIT